MIALALLLATAPPPSTPLPSPSPAVTAPPVDAVINQAQLQTFVLDKLDYDARYFAQVLTLHGQGRAVGKLSPSQMSAEVARARRLSPVLARVQQERAAFVAGTRAFTLPSDDAAFREYTNLLAILNMAFAQQHDEPASVLRNGARVVVKGKEDLGRVRGADSAYYVEIYRRYFFLMSQASFETGDDAAALGWLSRLEGEAELVALKQDQAQQESAAVTRSKRIAELKKRPLAVAPFDAPAGDEGLSWVKRGLADILQNDLSEASNLVVVERSRLEAVADEVALALAGFTAGRDVAQAGSLTGAQTLVIGSVSRRPGVDGRLGVLVRLVDADTGEVLASATGDGAEADLIVIARTALVDVLTAAGFDDGLLTDAVNARHPPAVSAIKALQQARLLLATRSKDARALYEQAVKEDPALASLYEQLKERFADVAATVAVLPIANLSGRPDDAWRSVGVSEALASDLPRFGFTLVERQRLHDVTDEDAVVARGMVDVTEAQGVGQRLSADFVVIGSLLRQAPRLRADLRFVEVKTGTVVYATSAENDDDDLVLLLRSLSREVATRFSTSVSEETLGQLAAARLSPADFERQAKAQLAKDALDKNRRVAAKDDDADDDVPAPVLPWVATGALTAGAVVAATGFLIGVPLSGRAQQLHGAASLLPENAEGAAALRTERDDAALWSNVFVVTGWIGALVASIGAATLAVDALAPSEEATATTESTTTAPLATASR